MSKRRKRKPFKRSSPKAQSAKPDPRYRHKKEEATHTVDRAAMREKEDWWGRAL